MRTERKFALVMAVLSVLAIFAVVRDIKAAPFGYVHAGTVQWVPSTSTNQLLDLTTIFNVNGVNIVPDLLIARSNLGSSGTDFRLRLIQSKYEHRVGLSADREYVLIATDMTAAEKDTLFRQDLGSDGLGASLNPAAGASYYGTFYWALAPASTDTITFDAYDLVQ